MPFDRPTLSELLTRTRSDFRSRLGITGNLLRRAMADTLAQVWSAIVHMTHGHLDWLSIQLFADTATREFLLRIAAMYGITPTAATFASGTAEATGVNGSTILLGDILVRDDGATYEATAGGTIAGGVVSIPVIAQEAGSDGGMLTGDTLEWESPSAGVDSTATIETPGMEADDEESTESLRTRLLLRLREPPQGGTDSDYEGWALAVAGVTRVWIYRHEDGLGTVKIRFVRDEDVSIFPDAGEVSDVQAAIDVERPTTAEPTVIAPVDDPTAFTIAIVPDTAANRTAVEDELDDLYFRDAEPGDGAGRGTVLISAIQTAIGVSSGITDYTLTVPAANVVPGLGDLPTIGVITWA